MSQRLSIPKTNPIGFTVSGDALFDLRGFAPDGDGDGGDGGDGSDGSDGDDADGSGSEGGDNDGDNDGGKAEDKGGDEIASLKARMQAADRRAAAAEKKAQELEDANLSEAQRKEKELEDLRSFKTSSASEISGLKAQVAFLSNNDVSWQDPSIALSLLDLSDLRDEDGNVDPASLKRAIKKLATEKPFLVKTAKGSDGDGEGGAPSGGSVGGSKKSKNSGALSEDELRKRYPALYV